MFLVKQKISVVLRAFLVGGLVLDFYVRPAQGLKCNTCVGTQSVCKDFGKWKEEDCSSQPQCKSPTCDLCYFYGVVGKDNSFSVSVAGCGSDDLVAGYKNLVAGINCKTGATFKDPQSGQEGTAKICYCKTDSCNPMTDDLGGGSGSGSSNSPHPSMVVIMIGLLYTTVAVERWSF